MRAIGIVLAGGNSSRMKELSNKRAIAAMIEKLDDSVGRICQVIKTLDRKSVV